MVLLTVFLVVIEFGIVQSLSNLLCITSFRSHQIIHNTNKVQCTSLELLLSYIHMQQLDIDST